MANFFLVTISRFRCLCQWQYIDERYAIDEVGDNLKRSILK